MSDLNTVIDYLELKKTFKNEGYDLDVNDGNFEVTALTKDGLLIAEIWCYCENIEQLKGLLKGIEIQRKVRLIENEI